VYRARRLGRGSGSLLLSAIGGLVALSLAVAAPYEREEGIKLALTDAEGSLVLTNSREGAAILGASGMRPGDQATGSVRIGNAGTVPGALVLQAGAQSDVAGPAGGRLWARMQLAIADTTDAQHPAAVYDGPIHQLGRLALGALSAGQQREFRFVATLPNGNHATDNGYQGASLSALFTWTAEGDAAAAAPTPVPTPAPTAPDPAPVVPSASAPGPVAAPPDPTGDISDTTASSPPSADALLRLPSTRRCVSRRRFIIHLRRKPGVRIRSATVYVNGRTKVKVTGSKRLRAAITLRGLPSGTVKVRIVLTPATGSKLVSTRTYRTCKKKAVRAGKR
jgi:hypothetical protein